ncbi:DoxX family protein [Candidatus Neomarinimicrobiota bacterium]
MEENKCNRLQLIALVIMRVMIGWHFLYEGVAKLMNPNWSASGYLMQSKGIFAGFFRWITETPEVLDVVNVMNIWGLIAVGLGLILGCLTRIASVSGMALLLMYYLANPLFVGYYYSIPMEGSYLIVNKNLVEMAALFVITVTQSGRFAGIDLFIHKLFPKQRLI